MEQPETKEENMPTSTLKKIVLPALLTATLLSGALHAAEIVEHQVTWEGAMPAKTHNGTLDLKSLDIELEGTKPTSLKVVLDMTTIANTDIKKEKNRKKLEGHLKSEDFFFVKEHPEAFFQLKSWKDGKAEGVLNIRGVTVAKTVPLTIEEGKNGTYVLKSDFSFDRQLFNVNYQNRGLFGTAKNKMIGDDIDVTVEIAFKS